MHKLVISSEDQRFLELLKQRQQPVLQPLAEHYLQARVVFVPCSDGDQMPDLYNHQLSLCRKTNPHDYMTHTIALNGGALNLAEESPLSQVFREDLVLLRHIEQALTIKPNVNTVVLYSHFPCGAARLQQLGIVESLMYLFLGKERLRKAIPAIRNIACYFHVDYKGTKKTYFASRQRWEEWVSTDAPAEVQSRWNELLTRTHSAPDVYRLLVDIAGCPEKTRRFGSGYLHCICASETVLPQLGTETARESS